MFSINPFHFYVFLKGTFIQELKIRCILWPEILFSFFLSKKSNPVLDQRALDVWGWFGRRTEAWWSTKYCWRVFLKPALRKVLVTFPFLSGPCHNYSSTSALDQLITAVSFQELSPKTTFGSVKQCNGRTTVSQGEREGILPSTQHSSPPGHLLHEWLKIVHPTRVLKLQTPSSRSPSKVCAQVQLLAVTIEKQSHWADFPDTWLLPGTLSCPARSMTSGVKISCNQQPNTCQHAAELSSLGWAGQQS